MNEITRECYRCHKIKPLDEFEKDKRKKHGRGTRCKLCSAEQSFIWRHSSDFACQVDDSGSIRPGLRFKVLYKNNFTCQYCGAQAPDVKLEIDHVIPRSKGGTNDESNLITACKECNLGKRDMLL